MKVIFLGPPGSGKGTMAARVHEVFNIPHISTGEIFRENVSKQTDLGLQVKAIMDRGELVTDDITVAMVKNRLNEDDASRGFILDGFPRTIPQAKALSKFMAVDHLINLICSRDELIKRLTGRRFCPKCKRIYHIHFMPPRHEGICDDDATQLNLRDDDRLEAVENRLSIYEKSTAPLIEWYQKQGLIRNVEAGTAPDQVFRTIEMILKDSSRSSSP